MNKTIYSAFRYIKYRCIELSVEITGSRYNETTLYTVKCDSTHQSNDWTSKLSIRTLHVNPDINYLYDKSLTYIKEIASVIDSILGCIPVDERKELISKIELDYVDEFTVINLK